MAIKTVCEKCGADSRRPKVGIGFFVTRGNQILLGQRKSSHGTGEFGGPGGHLEGGESFEQCAIRELREEVGPQFKVSKPQFLCLTNLTKYHPKHYVDIGMTAEWISGQPKVMEPDKLVSWDWYDLDKLPSPLFACEENYIKAWRGGQGLSNCYNSH